MGGLRGYVAEQLRAGYNVNTIREYLVRYGYTAEQVDAAIAETHHGQQKTHVHISHAVAASVLIVIVISVALAFFVFDTSASLSLDQAVRGQRVIVSYELVGLAFPVRVEYVVDDATGRIDAGTLTWRQPEGTFAIPLPNNDAKVTVTATSGGDEVTRSMEIQGTAVERAVSCNDLVRNGDETGVDCGGSCSPCTLACENGFRDAGEDGVDCGGDCVPCAAQLNCDDGNTCTEDNIDGSACTYTPVVPCCGNGVCEPNEGCERDCAQLPVLPESQVVDKLTRAKEVAVSDPAEARRLCLSMSSETFADQCFREIAEFTLSLSDCDSIVAVRIRERCYTDIAVETASVEACRLIIDENRRDNCLQKLLNRHSIYACEEFTNSILQGSCEFLRSES